MRSFHLTNRTTECAQNWHRVPRVITEYLPGPTECQQSIQQSASRVSTEYKQTINRVSTERQAESHFNGFPRVKILDSCTLLTYCLSLYSVYTLC